MGWSYCFGSLVSGSAPPGPAGVAGQPFPTVGVIHDYNPHLCFVVPRPSVWLIECNWLTPVPCLILITCLHSVQNY